MSRTIKNRITYIAGGAALAMAATVGITVPPAMAAEDGRAVKVDTSASQNADLKYDNKEVIEFFVMGTGPVYDTHKDLAKKLKIKKQKVEPEAVDEVVAAYEKVDPDFKTSVTVPVQSNDPDKAAAAMERLKQDTPKVRALLTKRAEAKGAETQDSGKEVPRVDAQGKTSVYTSQVALVYNVVAGATAAVAAVAVVTVALYAPTDGLTDYERDVAMADISNSL
jgi:SdpC family antimicrobial peptide